MAPRSVPWTRADEDRLWVFGNNMVHRGERWADLEHEFNLAGRGRSNLALRLKWMKLNARGGPGAPPAPTATQGQAATTAPVVNGLNEADDDDDDEIDVDEEGNDDDDVSFVDDDEMTGDDAEEHPAAQPHPADLAMEARKEAAVGLMALTSGNQPLVPLPTPAASSSSSSTTTTPATISFTPINRPVRAAPCADLFKMEFDFIMSPFPTPVLSNVRAEPFEPKAWAHGPPRSFEAACDMRA